jgi:hypothetical protein
MESSSAGRGDLPHRPSFLRSLLGTDTRVDLVYDVLAHPEHAPSLTELDHSMFDTSDITLRVELEKLIEYGVLERLHHDGPAVAEYEYTRFYTLSDAGWATVRFFNGMFTPDIYERLSSSYERLLEEAPPDVQRAAAVPRPATDTSTAKSERQQ